MSDERKPIKNFVNSVKEKIEEKKKKGVDQGLGQKSLDEATPTFEQAQNEHVMSADSNAFVIIGKDRPSILSSGYGGKGASCASRLDLIAGLASSWRNKDGEYGQPNSDTIVNPSFAIDAARIYISQKADIDAYMGLAPGPRDESEGRSAIGLKADVLRMHARTDIKLITGRGKFEGSGGDGERLSTGGVNEVVGTISFIAGNYTEPHKLTDFSLFDPTNRTGGSSVRKLQQVPKGDNLMMALDEILGKLTELNTRVARNSKSIYKLNNSMVRHVHATAVGPSSNPLDHYSVYPLVNNNAVADQKDKTIFTKDVEFMRINYLNPIFGGRYINSKFVFTT